jgi:cyclopropane fatty-acyl-phospholipid synthase-like methyltransferase
LKILDLGCGKGAVSVRIAQKLGCACFGIDGIPEFIDEANRKAREFQVEHLCRFTVGDIREQVRALSGFDIIILGSIGPVFGDFYTTLTTLKNCLSPQGVLIIDDGYIPDNSDFTHPLLQKRSEIYQQIQVAGMQLIDEFVSEEHNIRISDEYIYSLIEQRCAELSQIYPTKSYLFENYLSNQTKANDVLENEIVCSAMVIIPVAN